MRRTFGALVFRVPLLSQIFIDGMSISMVGLTWCFGGLLVVLLALVVVPGLSRASGWNSLLVLLPIL